MLAYQGNQPLAAGLFLHWQQTLTYKYAASSDQVQSLRPNYLLTWTAIRWGCENGFRIFDFGRTDVADIGLRTFKSRWGAVELPLIYSTMAFHSALPKPPGIESPWKPAPTPPSTGTARAWFGKWRR